MTALDVIVFVALAGGAVQGFRKGFVEEALSLIAWLLAIVAVTLFHASVVGVIEPYVGAGAGAVVLGFVLTFGIPFGLGKWLARTLGNRTRKSIIGPFDRALGVGFGLVKGLLLATTLFLLGALVFDTIYGRDQARPAWMTDSRTYPLLSASGAAIREFVDERRRGDGTDSNGREPT